MIQGFLAARRARSGTSALVRMPTGTGESGVIAVAAHLLVETGDVLLFTPWDVLVRQLADDIRSRFWGRIGGRSADAKGYSAALPVEHRRVTPELPPGTI